MKEGTKRQSGRKDSKNIMRRTMAMLLVLFGVAAFFVAPGYAKDVWYPGLGEWVGTAPSCDGECGSDQFAWCVSANGGCSYSDAYSPPKFGHICTSGRKAYCVSTDTYPQVTDYGKLNKHGKWVGTAPSCSGFCEDSDEFAICRSADGESCAYAKEIDAKKLKGHGADCASGRKAFCIKIDFIDPSF